MTVIDQSGYEEVLAYGQQQIAEAEQRAWEDAWIADNRSRRFRNSGAGIVRATGLTIAPLEFPVDDIGTEGEES